MLELLIKRNEYVISFSRDAYKTVPRAIEHDVSRSEQDSVRFVHGLRSHFTPKHANSDDGQHLRPRDRAKREGMDEAVGQDSDNAGEGDPTVGRSPLLAGVQHIAGAERGTGHRAERRHGHQIQEQDEGEAEEGRRGQLEGLTLTRQLAPQLLN